MVRPSASIDVQPILRVLVCGSVDDGKSTLIGRLLLDGDQVPEDQIELLAADSRVHGTLGGEIDPALLTDGLSAEREQGITIDVAWRQFVTSRRRLLIADTPGHVQHTRNMATGASGCRAALVLVDASRGVGEQTRRHVAIAALMGIRLFIFAINKVDLIEFDEQRFTAISEDCQKLAERLGIGEASVTVIPVVARDGDNVTRRSDRIGFWSGATLLEVLEGLDIGDDRRAGMPLRFPVQLTVRPDRTFRGYAGTVASGTLAVGDRVRVLPAGVSTAVKRLLTFDGELQLAAAGTPVTVVLADDVDLARGDLLVPDSPSSDASAPLRARRIDATLVWLDHEPATSARRLLLRAHTGTSAAAVGRVHYTLDMASLERRPSVGIGLNDVVRAEVLVEREHIFDPYEINPVTGSFVLIDRSSQAVVAAGLAHGHASEFDRETTGELIARPSLVDAASRAARLGHRPATLVITGMSGSGKTTLALALEQRLFERGATVVRLDGEALRLGLSRGLGFGPHEREEHLRRAAETARLLNDHGHLVLLAAQAPIREVRARMAEVIGADRMLEIHLHAPEEIRRERDPSGAHAAVERGAHPPIPGVTVAYEPPDDPVLAFDTSITKLDDSVEAILFMLRNREILDAGLKPFETR